MPVVHNWMAVIVCGVIGMLVPALWYLPSLFGDAWQKLSGLSADDLKKNTPALGIAALCSLVQAFALSGFMNYFGSQTFGQGALAGIQLWAGFTAASLVTDYRFAQRPWKLAFINLGHSLIVLTLTGGILAAWK